MRRKVIILPLSVYVNPDQQKASQGFSALGVSGWDKFWHWMTLNVIFNRYKRGRLTSAGFKKALSNLFPHANFSKKAFESLAFLIKNGSLP